MPAGRWCDNIVVSARDPDGDKLKRVDWIHLARGRVEYWAHVITIINLFVP